MGEQEADSIRIGKSKDSAKPNLVFLRDWTAQGLSARRADALSDAGTTIKSWYRGAHFAKVYRKESAAWTIQSVCRTRNAFMPYQLERHMSLAVQKEFRRVLPVRQAGQAEDIKLMKTNLAET